MGYKAENVSLCVGEADVGFASVMCFPSKMRWMLAINSVVTISCIQQNKQCDKN